MGLNWNGYFFLSLHPLDVSHNLWLFSNQNLRRSNFFSFKLFSFNQNTDKKVLNKIYCPEGISILARKYLLRTHNACYPKFYFDLTLAQYFFFYFSSSILRVATTVQYAVHTDLTRRWIIYQTDGRKKRNFFHKL